MDEVYHIIVLSVWMIEILVKSVVWTNIKSMLKEANECTNGHFSSKCEKCPII